MSIGSTWKIPMPMKMIFVSADMQKEQHVLEAKKAYFTMMERFILFVRTEGRMLKARYGAIFPALMRANHRKKIPQAG